MVERPCPEVSKRDAELYVNRLVASCDLLRSIDSGNFPISHYSSGEFKIKRRRGADGKVYEESDPVFLPLYKDPKSSMLGLRFLVCSAIFSDFMQLSEWGAREQALEVINERRLR